MNKGKKPSTKVSKITPTKKFRDAFTPGITIDMDTNMVSLSKPFMDDYLKTQANIQQMLNYLSVNQEIFTKLAQMQQRIVDEATLPLRKFAEDMARIASFQNVISGQALAMQNIFRDTILNSGILDIANAFKSIHVEMFAGLVIKSDFLDTVRTSNNGILEVSEVKSTKLLAGGHVKVDIEKNTTSVSTQVIYQKVDTIATKLEFINGNLSATKEGVDLIQKMMKDEKGLLEILQTNPFPYFKIGSIEFHPQKSLFKVNNEITIPIPQYSMMENLCIVLFSGRQELGEEWYLDSIQEAWRDLVDIENYKDITWKQILTIVDDINTLFAKHTTKDDLIIIERPKRIRLNPKYFSA
ncbi:MAG: hypothetical protein WCJ58_08705 [bacterium]